MQKNTQSDVGKFRERIVGALQRRIGPAMPFTYKHISQMTGKHPRTVQAWCELNQRVADEDLAVLIKMFGPTFANEIFCDTGCTVFVLSDERKRQEVLDALAVLARAAG